jgi:hypothetical protein
MKMTVWVAAALLVCARGGWAQGWEEAMGAGLAHVAEVGFDDPDDDESPEDEAYEDGNDAIGEEEWDDAVRAFDRVIALNGRRLDAALYWKAYALAQAGNRTEALSTIGQLRVSAPVKIGGVVVGQVSEVTLDPQRFDSIVTLAIDDRYKDLPADTSAGIFTAGLLGESYVGLTPGGDVEVLKAGGARAHGRMNIGTVRNTY